MAFRDFYLSLMELEKTLQSELNKVDFWQTNIDYQNHLIREHKKTVRQIAKILYAIPEIRVCLERKETTLKNPSSTRRVDDGPGFTQLPPPPSVAVGSNDGQTNAGNNTAQINSHAPECPSITDFVNRVLTGPEAALLVEQAADCERKSEIKMYYRFCTCSDYQGNSCPGTETGPFTCYDGYTAISIGPTTYDFYKNRNDACKSRGPTSVYCESAKVLLLPYAPGTDAEHMPQPPKPDQELVRE